jgi:antitoxin component HigA of HigAB toxin-antitoxin module
MEHYNKYIINIFERYTDLKKSKKDDFDNNDLWKIFEYYSCIKLSEEYKKPFYEYDDIDPTFKELNKMTRNDTGIDCSDLDNTIVQCKLRKNTLTWKECSTFFGSQVIFNSELKKPIIRWNNLIITRNNDCTLSENLLERKELFIDKPYNKNKLINFCENLIINPPKYPVFNEDFKLRDYQIEAINIIKNNKKNVIINLPTGTGKNSVIIYSMKTDLKYLILVPRIILMEQLKKEIIKHNSKMKTKIQLIGDGNDIFDENKLITICVFNSVHLIENLCMNFEKIFIDEAHHINKPAIYYENNDNKCENINNINKDNNDKLQEYFSDSESIISIDDIDDIEDELINVKNYTKIIKSLIKYNNNVYLSATIDSIDNFEYYSKDIRNMIELKYLCDYQIHVPIFNDDPTNKNICSHLLKNYRSIIIYCNSQKEGKLINKLMNEIQLNSSEYLDCNTQKKKRNIIIEKYKNGEIPFLVNVKILVEGFDAPITKGVCFLHLPTNKTTLIQIIGRCLRLHLTKTIANIILPFSSKEDEKNICNFLKIMAKNDSRIKKSYINKQLGGYISVVNTNDNNDNNDDIEFKYNMIYNSLGILQNSEKIWNDRLEIIKKYIDKNNKRPSTYDKNINISNDGKWLCMQRNNYKKNKFIMSNLEIRKLWEAFINDAKYSKYFLSNEEEWKITLERVKKYIDENNKFPSRSNNNDSINNNRWINRQQDNYKKKKQIMNNPEICKLWEAFINNPKYSIYFISNEEQWKQTLEKVKKYINENNKRPSECDKNIDIRRYGIWFGSQQYNYKKKKQIMNNPEICKLWEAFINDAKYSIYFISNEEEWKQTLEKVKKYINENNKRPSEDDKNIDIRRYGIWFSSQQQNYKKSKFIMSNTEIRKLWEAFINEPKYSKYFLSNEEEWKIRLEKVKIYIDDNNKRPSNRNKNPDIRSYCAWISTQQKNYKKTKHIMNNHIIYKLWEEFINDIKYSKYF